MISLLLPSRNRVAQLGRLLDSVNETCPHRADVEVLVAADDDDFPTIKFIEARSDARRVIGPQLGNLAAYFNLLASCARGSHFWILNDDCIIEQFDFAAIMALPDKHYGRTHPVMDGRYSEFPVLTIGGMQALGWLMNPALPGWGEDANCWHVYETASRVVDLPGCVVRHERGLDGTPDFERMRHQSGNYLPLVYADCLALAERLKS